MAAIDERAAEFDHNDHAMRARCAEATPSCASACPVFHCDAWGGFWVASRYEDVYEVGRDVERFASGARRDAAAGGARPPAPADGVRPARASRTTAAAAAALRPGRGRRHGGRRPRARARPGREDRRPRRADLYETLCKPLPLLMITRLLGIERDETFWAWTDTLMYGRVDGTLAEARSSRPPTSCTRSSPPRSTTAALGPADDLISLMLQGDGRGPALPRGRDARPLLLPAHRRAGEHRLRHPRDAPPPRSRARPPRRRARRPGARAQPRRAVAAPVLAGHGAVPHGHARHRGRGQQIPAGERDPAAVRIGQPRPAVFQDADDFHLDRRDGRHVAFGIGPHRCVGSHPRAPRDAHRGRGVPAPRARLPPRAGPDPGWYDAERAERRVGRARRRA